MLCDGDFRNLVKHSNAHHGPIHVYVDLEKLDLGSFIDESDDEDVKEDVKEDPHCEGNDYSEDSEYKEESESVSESESVTESEGEGESGSESDSDSSDCPSLDHLSAGEEELVQCRKMKQNRKVGNAHTPKIGDAVQASNLCQC